MKELARDEVASLCGLVLKRVGDELDERTALQATSREPLQIVASVFAEALRDFSGTRGAPGKQSALEQHEEECKPGCVCTRCPICAAKTNAPPGLTDAEVRALREGE